MKFFSTMGRWYNQNFIAFLIVIWFASTRVLAQDRISGKVVDAITLEPLVGATIFLKSHQWGVTSDTLGLFYIPYSFHNQVINISFIGYRDTLIFYNQIQNNQLVALKPDLKSLETVIVQGKKLQKVSLSPTGGISLQTKAISELPAFMGTSDPIKVLSLLPGMNFTNEAEGGIFVRGSNNGQNLVLLDGIPVQNPTHLLGFFSTFSESITEQVQFYKSTIPAKYGSKASSVIDVKMKSTAKSLFSGELNTGMIGSSLTFTGQTKSNKFFYLISARNAYLGLIKKLSEPFIKNSNTFFRQTDYDFTDYYIKIKYNPTNNSSIFITGFMSSDNYKFTNTDFKVSNKLAWHNKGASLKYSIYIKSNFTSISHIGYSGYDFTMQAGTLGAGFKLTNLLEQLFYHQHFELNAGQHKITFGGEFNSYLLKPNNFTILLNENSITGFPNYKSTENAVFLSDEWQFSPKWLLHYALRTNIFDSFVSYEPRISMLFTPKEKFSINTSFTSLSQPIHLIPIGLVSLPTDFWMPSVDSLKPEKVNQYAIDFIFKPETGVYNFSTSIFYRTMSGLLELDQGIYNNPDEDNFRKEIRNGIGKSGGIELLLNKETGRLTGWISATFSKSIRNFPQLQDGYFKAKYDKPVDVKVVGIYRINTVWNLSSTFMLNSGSVMSLPIGRALIQGNIINDYDGINNFRMPLYHRLDISLTRKINMGLFKGVAAFSVFNVYNRKNPFYYFYSVKGNLNDYYLKVSLERVSLFPILPSISIKLSF